jgi:CRP-like cAMP-binding protein
MSSEEKTYRSTNARVISDNMVLNVNLYFLRNLLLGLAMLGGIAFKFEQRIRSIESELRETSQRVADLKSIHDAEMKEIEAWYKKRVQVDLNPLNIFGKQKQK